MIGQAKGILMERYKINPAQAFAILARASMDTNLKSSPDPAHSAESSETAVPWRTVTTTPRQAAIAASGSGLATTRDAPSAPSSSTRTLSPSAEQTGRTAMSSHQPSAAPVTDARQAFAELGRVALGQASMESVLRRVAELAKQVIPGVAESSVSVVVNDKATTAAYTGGLALELDETQYGRGFGPCLEAAVGEELREITDARTETRWPDYAQVCVQRGSLSSLSVPVPVHQTVHAALNLYAVGAHAFGSEAADVARAFASYAAVAVGNMHLYETTRQRAENLEIAMQNRAVIEQAKGILMAQRRCDAAEAFNILAAASQRANRKLREIAAAIVTGVAERPQ
jgi:transcriptional regulator with GAF, ATPase, and Fis domain